MNARVLNLLWVYVATICLVGCGSVNVPIDATINAGGNGDGGVAGIQVNNDDGTGGEGDGSGAGGSSTTGSDAGGDGSLGGAGDAPFADGDASSADGDSTSDGDGTGDPGTPPGDPPTNPDLPPDVDTTLPPVLDRTPQPFIVFTFGGFSLKDHPNKYDFYRRLLFHFAAGVNTSSNGSNWVTWSNYRADVLSVNPNACMAPYYSAITSHNPIDISEYEYPPSAYDSSGNFLWYTKTNYSPRLDPEGFYAPLYIQDYPANPPRPPGLFAYYPYYEFRANGWILPETTYNYRPQIAFGHAGVRQFVINTLIDALENRHEHGNGITFDNASMFKRKNGSWPGKGGNGPYGAVSPDADFYGYLDLVRAALNARGWRLVCNSGGFRELPGHTDFMFWEWGLDRLHSTTKFKEYLADVKYSIDHGLKIGQRFRRGSDTTPVDSNMQDLMFFLAATMLVYERGMLACDFQLPSASIVYHPAYFELPEWLGLPLGAYWELDSNIYFRAFQNGAVLVNANDGQTTISDAYYNAFGLDRWKLPQTLAGKSGVVRVSFCEIVSDPAACTTLYTPPPPPPDGGGSLPK